MLKINDLNDYKSKNVLSIKKASELISDIRSKNKKVGLCHGGFDLLHAGHIKHFKLAKELCDVLFVSITSDKFVKLNKGVNRPIYPEKLRAYMISQIKFVDYVLISDFQTGIETIKLLKPDIYIKGPDYIGGNSKIIDLEKKAIDSVGGSISFTSEPKLSTTSIIEHIKHNFC